MAMLAILATIAILIAMATIGGAINSMTESNSYKQIETSKQRVQVETSIEPDAKIVDAWFIACERAAEYQLAGDSKNYLKWKREARRLAILLGY